MKDGKTKVGHGCLVFQDLGSVSYSVSQDWEMRIFQLIALASGRLVDSEKN